MIYWGSSQLRRFPTQLDFQSSEVLKILRAQSFIINHLPRKGQETAMSKVINLTPETFVDLFVICLSWQWNPASLAHTWTTVDKVIKILLGLGVISETQVALLRHPVQGRPYQSALYRRCAVVIRDVEKRGPRQGEAGGPTVRTQYVLGQPEWLCIVAEVTKMAVPLARLVRDKKIHLTNLGAAYADGLEQRYAPWVNRAAFKAEEARREALFQSEAAHAAAASAYRREVDEATGRQPKVSHKKSAGPACNLARLW